MLTSALRLPFSLFVFCLCCPPPPQLVYVASVTHGYVGADLKAVCREAALAALARLQHDHRLQSPTAAAASSADGADCFPPTLPSPSHPSTTRRYSLQLRDFGAAPTAVKPSAMRAASLVIDVPRVAWTDIGGQEDVKQKLKETVDWPLMVSFTRSTTGGK